MPEKSHSFKDFVMSNLPWLVAGFIGVGSIIGTISLQGILIFDLKGSLRDVRQSINVQEVRVDSMEKSLAKIEVYQETIKDDIGDIKRTLMSHDPERLLSGEAMRNLDNQVEELCQVD